MKKIILIIALGLLALITYGVENTVAEETFKNISATEAAILVKDKNVSIIDIRTAEEYKSGYIKGAINIDYYKADFKEKLSKLDKNKKYFIYCRSGRRSGSAKTIFNDLGFKNVYNLESGIQEWVAEKRELMYNNK